MLTHKNPKAGKMGHTPCSMTCGHCWKKMAVSMVSPIISAQNLVARPKARNSPPMASLAAPNHANNQGERLNGNPNFATSSGNQLATSNQASGSSELDHGIPNLLDPKSSVNNSPQKILGMAKSRLAHQDRMGIGTNIFFKLRLMYFI